MAVFDRTAELEAFVAPALARPALWRTVAGAGLAAVLWLLGVLGAIVVSAPAGDGFGRTGVVLFLASFIALAAGIALAARVLQGRAPRTLLGPGGFRAGAFGTGVAVIVLVTAPWLVLPLGVPVVRQTAPAVWAAWLLPALAAVLVQCAAEEAAFRGFLLQSLAARFRSAFAWAVLPSLVFGLLHWNPEELGRNAVLGVLGTTAVGLALTDVTARTGNLSAAIGLHFANNVVAILVVAMPSPVSGLALLLLEVDLADTGLVRALLLGDIAGTLIGWAAWRAIRHRRRLHSRGAGTI